MVRVGVLMGCECASACVRMYVHWVRHWLERNRVCICVCGMLSMLCNDDYAGAQILVTTTRHEADIYYVTILKIFLTITEIFLTIFKIIFKIILKTSSMSCMCYRKNGL